MKKVAFPFLLFLSIFIVLTSFFLTQQSAQKNDVNDEVRSPVHFTEPKAFESSSHQLQESVSKLNQVQQESSNTIKEIKAYTQSHNIVVVHNKPLPDTKLQKLNDLKVRLEHLKSQGVQP